MVSPDMVSEQMAGMYRMPPEMGVVKGPCSNDG